MHHGPPSLQVVLILDCFMDGRKACGERMAQISTMACRDDGRHEPQEAERSCGGKSSTKIMTRIVTDGFDICCADSGST